MPPPMTNRSFKSLNKKLKLAAKQVAQESMNQAAEEIRQSSSETEGPVDTVAMFNGTWQKRGHSSRTGAVTCITKKQKDN